MKIIYDADKNFEDLICAITKDPASFEKWEAIHFDFPDNYDLSDNLTQLQTTLLATIKQYFSEFEADIYVLRNADIYAVCKNISRAMLVDVGQNICDNFNVATKITLSSYTYDLFLENKKFTNAYNLEKELEKIKSGQKIKFDLQPKGYGDTDAKNNLGAKVLIVDDDDFTRAMLKKALGENYNVIEASNAEQAIKEYIRQEPKVIFLDINMPDSSGFDVLKEIRSFDDRAYIVMLSGNDFMGNIINSLNLGAAGFVAKPFNKNKLEHYISFAPSV
jgi:two-component system chemotaxis response regulator CheY